MLKLGKTTMKERYDENGMLIGDGSTHCTYYIEDFGSMPICTIVNESLSSESVYISYVNTETNESVKVRFSSHISNDVKFGAVIDGYSGNVRNEILYRLGFISREFVPHYTNHIHTQYVAKKKLHLYEECDKSLAELVALPEGTDISAYRGKRIKGTNEIITSDTVLSIQCGGHYEYKNK